MKKYFFHIISLLVILFLVTLTQIRAKETHEQKIAASAAKAEVIRMQELAAEQAAHAAKEAALAAAEIAKVREALKNCQGK